MSMQGRRSSLSSLATGGRQATVSSEPGHELISNNECSVPMILPLFPSDPPFSETSDACARSLLPKWVRSTAGGRARSTVGGSASNAAAGARTRTRKPWPQGIESRLTGLDEFHDRRMDLGKIRLILSLSTAMAEPMVGKRSSTFVCRSQKWWFGQRRTMAAWLRA
jgi:hypothetical protein